jgi:hypothetical protein
MDKKPQTPALSPEQQDSALSPEQQDTAALLNRLLGNAIANRYVDFCRLAAQSSSIPRVRMPSTLSAN